MKLPKAILRSVGAVSILLAVLGLFYNGMFILAEVLSVLSGSGGEVGPFYYPAFYTMSTICIVCYILLLTLGVQFVRLNTSNIGLFVFLFLFEIIYWKVVCLLWAHPTIGMSVAEATGVANGGMMVQKLTLFPLWAIPASLWASYKLSKFDKEQ